MAWETIERAKPAYVPQSACPCDGVAVSVRRMGGGSRRTPVRYIVIKVGKALARSARFTQKPQNVRLMFGSGTDAGKVAVVIDQNAGKFVAKEQKNGDWMITMSARDAAGRFSLDFPAFDVKGIEAIRPENGQPPMFTFRASKEMLAVDELDRAA
jgi:hypothetical protein